MNKWIESSRPRTLPASIAGVIVGSSLAITKGYFQLPVLICCLMFALLAQISSNFANEYYDHKRGADKPGRVGPRRSVTEGDITPAAMKHAMFASMIVACLFGAALFFYSGWWIFPVGIVIALFAFLYSAGPYPLSYYGLGDVTVVAFFGVIPVCFTSLLHGAPIDVDAILTGLSIGLMSANILIVNNYRDVTDDKAAGKYTTVVIFGKKAMSNVYLFNGFIALALLSKYWIFILSPYIAAIPFIMYLLLHFFTWNNLQSYNGSRLNKVLAQTARNLLVFALTFSLALILLHWQGV